jgi:hypothetical protein
MPAAGSVNGALLRTPPPAAESPGHRWAPQAVYPASTVTAGVPALAGQKVAPDTRTGGLRPRDPAGAACIPDGACPAQDTSNTTTRPATATSGLCALVMACQRAQASNTGFRVVASPGEVCGVLAILRLDTALAICPRPDMALGAGDRKSA